MTNALLHRSDYPALERTIYLNQASLGMLGQPAVTAMQSFVENVGRHGNLFMSDADEVSYYENLRHQGSLILGSPPRQIAILSGASELLASCLTCCLFCQIKTYSCFHLTFQRLPGRGCVTAGGWLQRPIC